MSIRIDGTNGISGVDGTAAAPAVQGNDTNTGIFFPANDTIAFAEGGTEVMRIDANGNVGVNTQSPIAKLHIAGTYSNGPNTDPGLVIQNTVANISYKFRVGDGGLFGITDVATGLDRIQINSTGVRAIQFAPTQVASSDANTLDDYEEGTWTPRIDSNNGQGTFTTKVGHYIKIGRKVTAWFLCDGGNSLAAGTTQYLGGLPFSIFSSYSGTTCIGQMGTNGPTIRTQQLMTLSANRSVAYVYIGGSQETTTITYATGVLEYLTDN